MRSKRKQERFPVPVRHVKKGTITIPVPISKATINRSLERNSVPGTDATLCGGAQRECKVDYVLDN